MFIPVCFPSKLTPAPCSSFSDNSSLPGAAPIHHTILHGLRYSGVTLQTMSLESFDKGTRLLQLPPSPGFALKGDETPSSLVKALAPIAADALITGLRKGLHVPPYSDGGWAEKPPRPKQYSKKEKKLQEYHRIAEAELTELWGAVDKGTQIKLAPKITKQNSRIMWTKAWTADQLVQQHRAFGPLFTKLGFEGDPRPPALPRWINPDMIKVFLVSCLHYQRLDRKEIWRLHNSKDEVSRMVGSAMASPMARKVKLRRALKEMLSMQQSADDSSSSRDAQEEGPTKKWINEVILKNIPKGDFSHFVSSEKYLDSLTSDELEFLTNWFLLGLKVVHHYLDVLETRLRRTRVIFGDVELLSDKDAAAARLKFCGRDIGIMDGPYDTVKLAPRSVLQRSIGSNERKKMQWVRWMDPILMGKNSPQVGGPRHKEPKQWRRQRKLAGIKEVPEVWSDSPLSAEVYGQVWPDCDETGRSAPGQGSVLIPATSGSGVVRVREMKEEGLTFKPAMAVLMNRFEELLPSNLTNRDPMSVGHMFTYETVQLFTHYQPPRPSFGDEFKLRDRGATWRHRTEGRRSNSRESALEYG